MIDIRVDRFPIAIVCSPRTGSSALLFHLANKYKIMLFAEIFRGIKETFYLPPEVRQSIVTDRKRYFESIEQNKKNFVVKLMPKEINYFSSYDSLLQSDCYKIKLSRRSKINQIASLYIAGQIKKFHTYDNEVYSSYKVRIDKVHMIECIEIITHSNFLCQKLPYVYDQEVIYEDLGFITNTQGMVRTSNHTYSYKPDNYEEICEEIKKLIGDNPC